MNNKLEKSKKLIQNVFLFFLASFIPKTISFFMVPLYTEWTANLTQSTAQTRLRAVFLYHGGERRNFPRGLD